VRKIIIGTVLIIGVVGLALFIHSMQSPATDATDADEKPPVKVPHCLDVDEEKDTSIAKDQATKSEKDAAEEQVTEPEKDIAETQIAEPEKEAAESAPMVFDRGVAHQTNKQYEQAIEAYDEYLKQIGEEGKLLMWSFDAPTTMSLLNLPGGGVTSSRDFGFPDLSNSLWTNTSRVRKRVLVTPEYCYYWAGKTLLCHSMGTGKMLWKKIFARSHYNFYTVTAMIHARNSLFVLSDTHLHQLNATTGKELKKLRRREELTSQWLMDERLFLSNDGKRAVLTSRAYSKKDHTAARKFKDGLSFAMTLFEIDTGKSKLLKRINDKETITAPSYARQGDTVRVSYRDTLHTVKLTTGIHSAATEPLASEVYRELTSIARRRIRRFTPLGTEKRFVLGEADTGLRLIDTIGRKVIPAIRGEHSLSWYVDGDRFYYMKGQENLAILLDLTTQDVLWQFQHKHLYCGIAAATDGKLVLNNKKTVRCINTHAKGKDKKSQVSALFNRGVSKTRMGRTAEGIKDLQEVIDVDVRHMDAYYEMAKAHLLTPTAPGARHRALVAYDHYTDFGEDETKLAEANRYFKSLGIERKVSVPLVGLFNGNYVFCPGAWSIHDARGNQLWRSEKGFTFTAFAQDYFLSSRSRNTPIELRDCATGDLKGVIQKRSKIIEPFHARVRFGGGTYRGRYTFTHNFITYQNKIPVYEQENGRVTVRLIYCKDQSRKDIWAFDQAQSGYFRGMMQGHRLLLHFVTSDKSAILAMLDLKEERLLWQKRVPSERFQPADNSISNSIVDFTKSRIIFNASHKGPVQIIEPLTGKVLHSIDAPSARWPIHVQNTENTLLPIQERTGRNTHKTVKVLAVEGTEWRVMDLKKFTRSFSWRRKAYGFDEKIRLDRGRGVRLLDGKTYDLIEMLPGERDFDPIVIELNGKRYVFVAKRGDKITSIFELADKPVSPVWFK
jgi:tetratricopeptide (TPR) repeat protein